jgi:hypothetical protein
MNRKMLNKMTLIFGVAIFVLLFTNRDKLTFDYDVVDYFEDNNKDGDYVFMFIEVNKYDTTMMKLLGQKLKREHKSMRRKKKSDLKILASYFYITDDTVAVTPKADSLLKKNYPDRPNLKNKLFFIENGYVYLGFSKPVKGFSKQDTLFPSEVFIPRKGYRAEDVLKMK